MATIVEEQETHTRYVLIGAGYAAYMSKVPDSYMGTLRPEQTSGSLPMAAVCTAEGEIAWFYSDQLRVVSIDGKSPAEVLGA